MRRPHRGGERKAPRPARSTRQSEAPRPFADLRWHGDWFALRRAESDDCESTRTARRLDRLAAAMLRRLDR